MDRKLFPGCPLPSRSRGWAIASAIDHVSVVRNKVSWMNRPVMQPLIIDMYSVRSKMIYLHIVNCHLDYSVYSPPARSTEMRVLNSIFSNFSQYPHSTPYTLCCTRKASV